MSLIDQAKQPDGGLGLSSPEYVAWAPGRPRVTLDGEFTADDLEAIAAHMRACK